MHSWWFLGLGLRGNIEGVWRRVGGWRQRKSMAAVAMIGSRFVGVVFRCGPVQLHMGCAQSGCNWFSWLWGVLGVLVSNIRSSLGLAHWLVGCPVGILPIGVFNCIILLKWEVRGSLGFCEL